MYGLSDEIRKEICQVFRQFPSVRKVVLFGSRAKGNYTTGSDIDLAVVGNNISFKLLMDLNLRIDDLELLYKVDLVDYRKVAGTPLGEHIDRVGQVFYAADETLS